MKILGSKSEIHTAATDLKNIHLSFKPSFIDILNLVKRCPGVKKIEVSPSSFKTLNRNAKEFAKNQGIEIVVESRQGTQRAEI